MISNLNQRRLSGLKLLPKLFKSVSCVKENFEDLTPQALSADLIGLFKLRIGDYRVIYSFDIEAQLITIHQVGHRRDIYN